MKVFRGAAAPDNFITGLTATYALGMTGYAAVRDAPAVIQERARSWFQSSELVDRARLFGGSGFLMALGPAVCADMIFRPSRYGQIPRAKAIPLFLNASLTIGANGMVASLGEGARLVARSAISYMASRSVWIDHFGNDSLAALQVWDIIAVSILEELTRMLNDYASVRMREYETAHPTESA